MKNENKCFLTVSLENGIIITGENPDELREFLMNCYTAFYDCEKQSKEEGYEAFAQVCAEHRKAMLNAARTITKHMKGE